MFFEDSSYYTNIEELEDKGGVAVVTGRNVSPRFTFYLNFFLGKNN